MVNGIACLFEEEANDNIVFLISRHRKERQYLFMKYEKKEVLMF
jgi:hypothetical protein